MSPLMCKGAAELEGEFFSFNLRSDFIPLLKSKNQNILTLLIEFSFLLDYHFIPL
jgi:hypothetical protein